MENHVTSCVLQQIQITELDHVTVIMIDVCIQCFAITSNYHWPYWGGLLWFNHILLKHTVRFKHSIHVSTCIVYIYIYLQNVQHCVKIGQLYVVWKENNKYDLFTITKSPPSMQSCNHLHSIVDECIHTISLEKSIGIWIVS